MGVNGEEQLTEDCRFSLPIPKLVELVKQSDLFISVENFMPHLANHYGKAGIVIFGQSDPKIWGYERHTNLLKDKKYLRPDAFGLWESVEYNEEVFIEPEKIFPYIK